MGSYSKELVFSGYDKIADKYLELFGVSKVRQKWFDRLVDLVPNAGANILDLGCGAGIPVARDLCSLGHKVIGVDGSKEQIAKAKINVPDAEFIQSDMSELDFLESSFDGISAFYSMTHLPAQEQCRLISNISFWLKPGATFIGSFGSGDAGSWTGEWLGVPMFFDHNSETTTLNCFRNNNLNIREYTVEQQDNEDVFFLWVEAIKKYQSK